MGKIQEGINKAISASVAPATVMAEGQAAIKDMAKAEFEEGQGKAKLEEEAKAVQKALGFVPKQMSEKISNIDKEWEARGKALTSAYMKKTGISTMRAGIEEFRKRILGGKKDV